MKKFVNEMANTNSNECKKYYCY